MAAFHATGKGGGWGECGGRVSDRFWGSTKPSVHLLPGLLESGLQVMVFSGMQDLICNHVGSERMIENLQWLGDKGFRVGELFIARVVTDGSCRINRNSWIGMSTVARRAHGKQIATSHMCRYTTLRTW